MSTPLKIVHTEASQGWGGQEIRIITESQGMLERGHDVTLLSPASAKITAEAQRLDIPCQIMPYETKSLAAIRATRDWIRANPVDVINTHSSIDSWMVGLACIGLKNAPAVVRTRHISARLRTSFPTRWLYNSSARRVVTTGEKLRLEIIDSLGCPKEHAISVPTGIDLDRYNRDKARDRDEMRGELGIPADAFVIGIAATLRSWKGHHHLIEAFNSLADGNTRLHLLIAGDGPRRPRLEGMVADSPVSNRIHMIGHRTDVQNVLAAMDIFALPSYANEGVPQALMQAMAMDLPVISTTVGAINELVDEQTGLICNTEDSADLAAKLAMLINDPELRASKRLAGKQRVQQRYSKQIMVESMEAIFRQAIQQAHQPTHQQG